MACMFSKYKLFPVVVHEYVVLEVDLDPQDGPQHFYNYEIRILLEKLDYKHVSHVMFQNRVSQTNIFGLDNYP